MDGPEDDFLLDLLTFECPVSGKKRTAGHSDCHGNPKQLAVIPKLCLYVQTCRKSLHNIMGIVSYSSKCVRIRKTTPIIEAPVGDEAYNPENDLVMMPSADASTSARTTCVSRL